MYDSPVYIVDPRCLACDHALVPLTVEVVMVEKKRTLKCGH